MDPLVVENVSVRFGGLKAVQNVSFTMQAGERRALIGPNGAGKTTLFNVVAGQLTPTSGRIRLFGQDVTRLPPFRRAALGLARTFQITNLFPHLTVAENLHLAVQALQPRRYAMHRPLSSYRDVTGRSEQLLMEWRLWDRRDELARNLSYGDQRELEILMALAGDPRLLLLDEPTAGLSAAESRMVEEIVRALPRDITILLIEHDLDIAFDLADRVTVLHFGEILVDGSPADVRKDPRVGEIYIGSDLVQAAEADSGLLG
jgi:branched-chain amino acid transport system ATP-binding protein